MIFISQCSFQQFLFCFVSTNFTTSLVEFLQVLLQIIMCTFNLTWQKTLLEIIFFGIRQILVKKLIELFELKSNYLIHFLFFIYYFEHKLWSYWLSNFRKLFYFNIIEVPIRIYSSQATNQFISSNLTWYFNANI